MEKKMALFTIDENKCTKDKLCVMECPMQIITMKTGDDFPEPVKGAGSMCINCGHCVAVCPTGAFSLATMHAEKCAEIKPNWNPGEKVIGNYMKARRSIRRFKKEPVDSAILKELIEIASHAPSGHNSRPVQWTVFSDKEKIKSLAGHVIDWMHWMKVNNPGQAEAMHFDMIIKAWDSGIDVITYSGPAVIVAHASKANPFAQSSCTIALSHLEVAAPSFGLGCCWGGFISWAETMWNPLREALLLPDGDAMHGCMLTGHPLFKYHRVPLREAKIYWK
jgi:NAD-dependent dihydropyrimidine dehydrogenase PreA subunit